MTKGTGTYDDPIIVDGIFTKTIDGVKKFFKLNTGSKQSSEPSIDTDAFVKYTDSNLQGSHNVHYVDLSQDANAVISTNWYKSSLTLMTNSINSSQGDRRDLGTSLTLYGYGHQYYPACCRITANNPDTKDSSTFEVNATQLLWNKKNLVTSVNGIDADNKGNVKLNTGSSNCVQYDSTGAVTLKTKPQIIRKATDDSNLVLCGGNSDVDGGFVIVHGSKEKTKTSTVELVSQQGTQSIRLMIWSSQYSLPYIEIKDGTKTTQKGIVFSVNNKIATNGNVDVYPLPDTGASPTGMLQNQTVASKKITQSGVIYVNVTSANANATVNLFVNSFKVFGFQPKEGTTNFKMFSAIVGANDTVQFSYSNCVASWDFRPFK